MPPKKKDGKSGAGEAVEGEDPTQLLQNYQKYCRTIGLAINPIVSKNLSDEEKYPIEQLIIDDEYGPLGPGGTRALMTAVLGSGPGMKGGPYKLLKSIRIWRSNCSDDGASAVAEILRLGGAEVKITYLELLDNYIGPIGAMALGSSLSRGNNLSLMTLKLDYNATIGVEGDDDINKIPKIFQLHETLSGVASLCKGLRTNVTLKQLHLQFCNITWEGGMYLSELVANSRSAIEVLNVAGNRLGGKGLKAFCQGMIVNTKCETLCLADNMIDQNEEDLEGLTAFCEVLNTPTVALTSIDLMYNRIGEKGAAILIPALGPENTKIKEFLVDLTLPLPIFEQIFRKGGGGKKKGGKKKGGKKKK